MTKDNEQLVCSCSIVHEEAVQNARSAELPTARLLSLSELFKLLGDPSRLRIINALSAAGELCVCDLSAALDLSQSAMSHQLSQLRRARLVRSRKDGKAVFYALDDQHISGLLALAAEHAAEGRE
ncbi:MAG TPA: transcriptional regulator [Spirochaetaceae bacterium]|jgi:ArsR family transcriptional regulator|nr:transcriptional regulator [Spirochaetaceae bacterium]